MVVAAIVCLVVILAISNMRQARMEANQQAVVQSLQAVRNAQVAFWAAHQRYAGSFDLLMADQPKILTAGWQRIRHGYQFSMDRAVNSVDGYEVTARPLAHGWTGFRSFFLDQTGVIRQNAIGPVNAASPVRLPP